MNKAIAIFMLGLLSLPGWAQDEYPRSLHYREVVELAEQRNLTLASDAKEVDMARSRLDQAVGLRRPTLGIDSIYNLQEQSLIKGVLPLPGIPGGPGSSQLMLNSLGLQVPIYTGGRLESAIHQNRALIEVNQQNLQRSREEVAYQAKQLFLQAVLARENSEVAQQTLVEANETLRQSEARKKAGTGTKFDVMQAKVAVSNAEQQVISTQTAYDNAQATLAILLHFPVDTRFELAESLLAPQVDLEPVVSTDLKSLTVVALDQRPELASLRAQLRANHEAENVAQSGIRPQVSMDLSYAFVGAPSSLQGGWSILALLSVPIYDGGVTHAKVGELKHREEQLALNTQRQVDQVALDVKQALLSLQNADSRVATATRQVDEAREAVRLARVRFLAGAGTSLELVSAQASYASAQYALADARYGQIAGRAQLNLALGLAPGRAS